MCERYSNRVSCAASCVYRLRITVAFRAVLVITRWRRIVKSTLKTTPSTVSRNLNACADSACTYSDHVQCHVEPTKRYKTRRAASEELIVMHDCTNATAALSTVKKNKGNIFFRASRGDSRASQPQIRLTNLFCTATPLTTWSPQHGKNVYNIHCDFR